MKRFNKIVHKFKEIFWFNSIAQKAVWIAGLQAMRIINRGDKIFVIFFQQICQKGMKDDICVNKSAQIEIDTDAA